MAIVDFDIHHGNGTEDIIKNLRPRTVSLPLPPSWPNSSYTVHKPWYDDTDPDHVFFGSINLVDESSAFYPGTGNSQRDDRDVWPNVVNVSLSPVGPVPGDLRARAKLSAPQRQACCRRASDQFRERVSRELMPALTRFNPGLLILSSGFDGHSDDFYHFLTEADYGWLTEQMVLLMRPRGGRIVSLLEGGYSLEPAVKVKAPKGQSKGKAAAKAAKSHSTRSKGPSATASSSSNAQSENVASGTSASSAASSEQSDRTTRASPPSEPAVAVAAVPEAAAAVPGEGWANKTFQRDTDGGLVKSVVRIFSLPSIPKYTAIILVAV